ncbi:2'-5' RNA ligase family protein [Novosphingobium sp.]|uniref:2'-5' RNA ligase family protein n=1 Tax=Novosphingobium sp. TaxID=1874826 RepID=UPI003342DDD8
MTAPDRTPLIVLALLPDAVQARLDALRRAHYPPERNRVPAHCTLFHAVPGMVGAELTATLATLAATTPPMPARIDRVIDLDGGTALGVFSPELVALREALADRFHGLLTGGDAVPARLHVTVQNKVERRTAHILQSQLRDTWQAVETTIPGIAVHRVIDGAWHPVGVWRLRQQRR